ncbi:hypothetical protein [Halomonas sp. 328]|uniref:hypothetical protein n=1 Tax=Halomonas sp. 328 TaxID=2776704 RepID=UPI0018A6EAF5|nr:hypothetical protein [Halomonas sp. 328]MBF8221949.1 hypothetical protein [Halomonas sp. 328]
MTDKKLQGLMKDSVREARNALRSLDRLMHGVAMIIVLIGIVFILASAVSTTILTAVSMVIVFSVSLAVYISTQSFGEGALALIFGLVGIFSVEWTTGGLVAFNFAWVAFSGLAFIIAGIRSAGDLQVIMRDAAQRLAECPRDVANKEKKIDDLVYKHQIGSIGAEGVAKIIRLLAYRGVSEDLFSPVIEETGRLVKFTRISYDKLSAFLIDLIRRFEVGTVSEFVAIAQEVRQILDSVKATPEEFFASYEESRSLLLGDRVDHHRFFVALGQAIDEGVQIQHVHARVSELLG